MSPYSEASGAGLLRYVQLTAAPSAASATGRAEDDPFAQIQVRRRW